MVVAVVVVVAMVILVLVPVTVVVLVIVAVLIMFVIVRVVLLNKGHLHTCAKNEKQRAKQATRSKPPLSEHIHACKG